MFLTLIQLMILLVSIMLSVAFFSLFERKMLALIQFRKGPNKVGLNGVMQPISDALKLIMKFNSSPLDSLNWIYFFMPSLFFTISLLIWMVIPILKGSIYFMQSSLLFIVLCMSVSIYMVIFLGWFSNSKYSMIGSIRSVVQTISYEIILSFLILLLIIMSMSIDIMSLIFMQDEAWLVMPLLCFLPFFFISLLAELNRTPFDVTEGESELVSGYCVEYGGILYTLIFLSENSSVMFMSIMLSFITGYNFIMLLMIISLMVWIRGSLPRIRFDMIMSLCWVKMLPLLLCFLLLLVMII
uniref:NADH dehydrogenase subunit 1 n=1 Tax=Anatoecus icterodes TaxID=1195957 RepID=UPI00211EE76B|nr:NADH dehydrogenase subunit 1 [Anatoecus icterodes]UTT72540.1 NADH dehydrogenase subunit 1 [Anatoecus icterodes]